MSAAGTIYDLEGNRVGRTADVVQAFLDALEDALAAGPCYIAASPLLPTAFVDGLRKFVPVVVDESVAPGRAEIVEGYAP